MEGGFEGNKNVLSQFGSCGQLVEGKQTILGGPNDDDQIRLGAIAILNGSPVNRCLPLLLDNLRWLKFVLNYFDHLLHCK